MNLPRILFVTYGGGHVNLTIAVIRALQARGPFDIEVLGLTTARPVLERAGIPSFGFRDLVRPGDEAALALGAELAGAHNGGPVSHEETVAYLGLSCQDLIERLGAEEAEARYQREGRQALLPLGPLRRLLRERAPVMVVATNSPRAERAAIEAASELGIPAVCLVDLFASNDFVYIGRPGYGRKVCVLSEHVLQTLVAVGRPAEDIVVTGNPAFDRLAGGEEQASRLRQTRGWGTDQVILWASQAEPARHPYSGAVGDPSLPRRIERALMQLVERHPSWRLVLRRHPSEVVDDGPLPPRVETSGPADDLPALLKAIDVVVTTASTLGLEAALCHKPVVALANSVCSPTVPYPAMGIARGAADESELEAALEDIFDGRWKPTGVLPPIGQAAERVVDVLVGELARAECTPS